MAVSKSSGAVIFRGAVMLTFLAAIPLVAMSGSSLPDVIRKALERYFPGLSGNKGEKPAEVLGEAPPFTGAKPVGENLESAYASSAPKATPEVILPPQVSDPGVVPAKYQTPEEAPASSGGFSAGSKADPFQKIQDRLRSLGATYYLLETWGNDQRLYRFYCEMAVAGDANFTRCFEATHAEALGAMEKVLSQVEGWRAGIK